MFNYNMSAFRSLEDAEKHKVLRETETKREWDILGPFSGTSHPYSLKLVPQVGDEISFGFNGDWYPSGVITRKTKTKIETSEGDVFRKDKSGFWKKNQMWSLAFGHINERNPEF